MLPFCPYPFVLYLAHPHLVIDEESQLLESVLAKQSPYHQERKG
ncbi:hypothetical protein VVATL9824_02817 [Vibrio vulnificus]|nr:hypothetical protein VVATL9824_02817 [Vibrio vulnificus]